MTIHILPTNDIIAEIFKKSQEMQCFDFDIEEMVHNVLNALTYSADYPTGFGTMLMMTHDQSGVDMLSEDDISILNEMISMLYQRIYSAINAVGLYDKDGILHHRYFLIYRNDIAISDVPLIDNPTS